MKAPQFKNRWLITGTLTTRSELHIGDGGAGQLHNRRESADKESKEEHDASTVCVDHRGTAYLPGSGVKGALRALVTGSDDRIDSAWEHLLGSDKPDAEHAVGGKLEFWDAFHTSGEGKASEQPDPTTLHKASDRTRPWWDHTRKTCVAVSVSLDRRTRSAMDGLLYHLEYVPAGETFTVEISGDNLTEEDIARVLVLLDRFNSGEATLGAQTSNGWGRMEWNLIEIRCLDAVGLEAWKMNPAASLPTPVRIDTETQSRIDTHIQNLILSQDKERLTIILALTMESPWLIRDPRQRERSSEANKNHVPDAQKPADAVPIADESGRPFVPAKSLRGVLRSRAEMILRTVGLPCADHPGQVDAVSTKGKNSGEVLDGIANKDLAAKLFGLGGWMAPLELTRLDAEENIAIHHQEFVAIDRFTGGAADGAKFNAELAGMTTVCGRLTVDLTRLKRVDKGLASLGLLALVLRDLAEGDLPIGSGSAKGQGFCTASATVTQGNAEYVSLADWFSSPLVTEALTNFRKDIPQPAIQ
jgi:CRISPR/Cas system CSM-associated protein Csm3 (group 7 of RAMP superfamily)